MAEVLGLAALLFGATAVLSEGESSAAAAPSTNAPPRRPTPAVPVGAPVADAIRPSDAAASPDAGTPRLFPTEQSFEQFVRDAQGGAAAATQPPPETLERLPPGRQPFFRSERTQGTNPKTSQFKTELFSGVTEMGDSKTGAWRHKAGGVQPFFPPTDSAARVTSSGSAGNPQQDAEKARERFTVSGTMNKALPFTQVRVGPGLGVQPEVAAEGGFHPFLRVMPNNVGVYKTNPLPGQVVPGAALVARAESRDFVFDKKMPPKFWQEGRRPPEPTGDPYAGLAAPRARPEAPSRPYCAKTDHVNPGDLRCPEPCGYGYAPMNVTNATVTNGGPSSGVASWGDPSDRALNNRTLTPAGQGTVAGPASATHAPGMTIEQFRMDEGRLEKLNRSGSTPFSSFTNFAPAVPTGTNVSQWSAPQATLRGIAGVQPYAVGAAAPQSDTIGGSHVAPESRVAFLQPTNLGNAKRPGQLRPYTPGAMMTRPDTTTYGITGIKGKEIAGRAQGPPEIQVDKMGFDEEQRGADTRPGRKTTTRNLRLWNSLAADQLKTNEYAITLATV